MISGLCIVQSVQPAAKTGGQIWQIKQTAQHGNKYIITSLRFCQAFCQSLYKVYIPQKRPSPAPKKNPKIGLSRKNARFITQKCPNPPPEMFFLVIMHNFIQKNFTILSGFFVRSKRLSDPPAPAFCTLPRPLRGFRVSRSAKAPAAIFFPRRNRGHTPPPR